MPQVSAYRSSFDTGGHDLEVDQLVEIIRTGQLPPEVNYSGDPRGPRTHHLPSDTDRCRALYSSIPEKVAEPSKPDGRKDKAVRAAWLADESAQAEYRAQMAAHKAWKKANEAYTGRKGRLPCFVVAGRFLPGHRHGDTPPKGHLKDFPNCNSTGLVEHSGMVVLDYDHLGQDAGAFAATAFQHPAVVFAFVSPSGDGVKVVAKVAPVPADDAEHRAAWAAVVAALSLDVVVDPSGKNLARLCYLCHDPNIQYDASKELSPVAWSLADAVAPKESGSSQRVTKSVRPRAGSGNTRGGAPSRNFEGYSLGEIIDAMQCIPSPVEGSNSREFAWQVAMGAAAAGVPRELVVAWGAGYHGGDDGDGPSGVGAMYDAWQPGGVGVGSLIYHAKEYGWMPPRRTPSRSRTAPVERVPVPSTVSSVDASFDEGPLSQMQTKSPADWELLAASDAALDGGSFEWPVPGTPDGQLSSYYQVGCYIVDSGILPGLRNWRYDSFMRTWHRWDVRNYWRIYEGNDKVPDPIAHILRHNQQVIEAGIRPFVRTKIKGTGDRAQEVPEVEFDERNLNSNLNAGLISGMRYRLTRDFPRYASDEASRRYRASYVSTSSLRISLADGTCEAPDRDRHDTKSVTNGEYRASEELELRRKLREYLLPTFPDDAEFDVFCRLLGLMFSGRAQSYRALWALVGGSGYGKGHLIKLLIRSLGMLAKTIGFRFLEESKAEIDAERYYIMAEQPLLLAFDELSSDTRLVMNKLLNLTGDNVLPGARLPYQHRNLEDTIPSVILLAMVEPPIMRQGTGLERRLFVLPFHHEIPAEQKNRSGVFESDLLDAVVTVGITEAFEVYQPGYREPEPLGTSVEEFLEDTKDDIPAWADFLPDSWDGTQLSEVMAQYQDDSGDRTVTLNFFSRQVKNSVKWTSKIRTVEGKTISRLTLK